MMKILCCREVLLFVVIVLWGCAMAYFGMPYSLEARLYYEASEVVDFFKTLNLRDRQAYQLGGLMDLGFIAMYTSLFFLLLKRFFTMSPRIKFLSLFAFAADTLETVTILLVLFNILVSPPPWLGVATFIKWILVMVNAMLITYGFVYGFIRMRSRGERS